MKAMKAFVSVCLLVCALPLVASADETVGPTSLPSGMWFRSGHYEGALLTHRPPTPIVAAITGQYRLPPDAERATRGVDRTHVGPGFPWVVANHDLRIEGVCSESIVVVAGLFASLADARAWQAADATRASLHLVALEDDADPHCTWDPAQRLLVIHVEPTRDAPAYAESDIARIADLQATVSDEAADAFAATLVPHCTVLRGSVFAFGRREARDADWSFDPARCGSEIVYVRHEHTLRATSFETTATGTRLLQVVRVQCDTPTTAAWSYTTETGRGEMVISPTGEACGDP